MSTFISPLISAKELNQLVGHDQLVILDASISPVGKVQKPQNKWPETAIANARFFDIESDFSDTNSQLPHTLPSVKKFQTSCQKLGINHDSLIVVYDNLGMFSSARAWYLLKSMGHQQVAVLNGGLPSWISVGLATHSVNDFHFEPGDFLANFDQKSFCNADYVQQSINRPEALIFDARATERFLGLVPEPRQGVRAGHIPHSQSLPYTQLLSNGMLKNKSDLQAIFDAFNNDQKCQWIVTCGSGITACILALAATIIGHDNICVYDGSWSDWGQDNQREVSTEPS